MYPLELLITQFHDPLRDRYMEGAQWISFVVGLEVGPKVEIVPRPEGWSRLRSGLSARNNTESVMLAG